MSEPFSCDTTFRSPHLTWLSIKCQNQEYSLVGTLGIWAGRVNSQTWPVCSWPGCWTYKWRWGWIRVILRLLLMPEILEEVGSTAGSEGLPQWFMKFQLGLRDLHFKTSSPRDLVVLFHRPDFEKQWYRGSVCGLCVYHVRRLYSQLGPLINTGDHSGHSVKLSCTERLT